MISPLLLATALAHPVDPLMRAMPAPPSLLFACASIQDINQLFPASASNATTFSGLLNDPQLAASGVDVNGPLMLALGSDNRQSHVGLQVPLSDAEAFAASPLLEEAKSAGIHWAISDDVALMFASNVRERDSDTLKARLGVGRMLGGLDPAAPGCTVAMDLSAQPQMLNNPMLTDLGLSIRIDAENPDHIVLRAYGLHLPDIAAQALSGERPRGGPIGGGSWSPMLVARLNIDLNAILEAAAEGDAGGAPPMLQGMAKPVWDEGVRFSPGAEIALSLTGPEDMQLVAAIPLKRPRRGAKLLRKLTRAMDSDGSSYGWDGELLRLDAGDKTVWLGSRGRYIFVGLNPDVLREAVQGGGAPWIMATFGDMAQQPGLFVQTDYSNESVRAMLERDLPEQLQQAAILAYVPEAGQLEIDIVAIGMGEAMQAAMLNRMSGEDEPESVPVKPPEPPGSSESAAVLSLIASRENEAKVRTGSFVPYAGGPRSIEALDATAQRWEGIPALGIEPMDTACRYEVSLGPNSFTARGICDEDDDGALSIRVVGASGVPERVTPEDVR